MFKAEFIYSRIVWILKSKKLSLLDCLQLQVRMQVVFLALFWLYFIYVIYLDANLLACEVKP